MVECRPFPWHLSASATLQLRKWVHAIIPIREMGNRGVGKSGAKLGLAMLSLFWGHTSPNEGLGALQWGSGKPGMCFSHLKQVLKFRWELSEMFLGLQLFVITALAFSGFLSHVVSLVFAFICLFIILIIPTSQKGSAVKELVACQGNFSPSSPRTSG